MAAQVEAASQAIALIPPLPTLDSQLQAQVVARVEALEVAQARIEEAVGELREIVEGGSAYSRSEAAAEEVKEVSKEGSEGKGKEEGSEETVTSAKEEVDIVALKKTVEDLTEKLKLE